MDLLRNELEQGAGFGCLPPLSPATVDEVLRGEQDRAVRKPGDGRDSFWFT